MGERSFVVREISTIVPDGITESELKARLAKMMERWIGKGAIVESDDIDILLKGERKDAWQEWCDKFPTSHFKDYEKRAFIEWLKEMPREGK